LDNAGSPQCLAKSCASLTTSGIYSVSQKKVAPPKTFCDIFTSGKPVLLKITVAIAQTYFYVYINFGPFI